MLSLKTLEKVREQKEWTHTEMAEHMDLSPRTWRRIRNIRTHKPEPETLKKITKFHNRYVGVFKRKIRKQLIKSIPSLDSNFSIYSSRRRGYTTSKVSLAGMIPVNRYDVEDYTYEQYFLSNVVSKSYGTKPLNKYLVFYSQYKIDYVNVIVNVTIKAENGHTFQRSYPSFVVWTADNMKSALIECYQQAYDSISSSLFANYKEFQIFFRNADVNLVTQNTKADITV